MSARRAFTLVELLLVIAILGIVSAVVIPNVGAIVGGTRSAVVLRTLVQMGRYTRSMALLNQTPCELVVDLDKRVVTTEMAEKNFTPRPAVPEEDETDKSGSRFSFSSAFDEPLYEQGASAAVSFGHAVSTKDRGSSERLLARNRPVEEPEPSPESDGSLADAIHQEKPLPEPAAIAFLGFSDTVEEKRFRSLHTSGAGETNGVIRIRYRTNGTCRPYRIAIGAEDDPSRAVIAVDAVGTPRVLRESDDGNSRHRQRW